MDKNKNKNEKIKYFTSLVCMLCLIVVIIGAFISIFLSSPIKGKFGLPMLQFGSLLLIISAFFRVKLSQ